MISRGNISSFIRNLGMLEFADRTRFELEKLRYDKENRRFKEENPHIPLPPDYLMYESFGMSYRSYFMSGRENAKFLKHHFSKFIDLNNKNILDWGCGPARIIRHMPKIVNNGCSFYGTDYNEKSIAWNKKNIDDVEFNLNTLAAKLPYENGSMDIIYGLSIFTHLSEEMHFEWLYELKRILRPGGILLISVQGDNFLNKLTMKEKKIYQNGELVVRGNVKEGHRTYSAFQPKTFMREMFEGLEILQHHIRPIQGGWIPQDIWIVRKN
ncbi:hypothetical protein GCM10009117_03360 [Gangjinia marincola]|uniref:Methyltransferase type 11 domain-containing protein n=1 Tax=Gangjinia marincola TaxID=578463 RepID=A0ABN1MDM9_9FLAO